MPLSAPVFSLPQDQADLHRALARDTGEEALLAPHLARAVAARDVSQIIALAESVGRPGDIRLYRAWLTRHGTGPAAAPIWYNLGTALHREGQHAAAAAAMEAAHRHRPDLWQAGFGRGLALEAAGQPEAALAIWRELLPPAAARLEIHRQMARLEEEQGRLGPAMEEARATLLIDPAQPDVIQHLVHNRQRTATWPPTDLDIPGVDTAAAERAAGPLAALALVDDPGRQAAISADWIARKVPPAGPPLAPRAGYRHDRIRIGYLSSDFCRHAMSFLIAGVLEHHDRGRFEIWGFDMSPEDGSDLRARVIGALDHHVRLTGVDDAAAARLIRSAEIDILIDLNGLTKGARPGILRHKPAPVQATYLGYIGPVPLPQLDWLICDAITVPPAQDADYLPRPLRIEGCYQANDSAPPVLPSLTREDEGLPPEGFVFTCMSHHYKLTEPMWQTWCRIVAAVPGSVLWLADDNPESGAALRRRWSAAGLAAERLIIAPRTDPARYRARLGLADLFLDTSPYNAGTVASDALRMHLPVVTLLGRAFAGRMCASLLTAVGLEECIAPDLDGYAALAVAIARDPARHRRLREHLAAGAWDRGLGDTRDFTRRFEAAMERICLRPDESRP